VRILVIADPIIPVPPINYGGTERVIDLMCQGLIRRGHAVHLIAARGSRISGGKLTVHRAPTSAFISRAGRKIAFQFVSFAAAMRADVVINFCRLDYLEAVHRLRVPVIHWFENPLSGKEVPFVLRRRRRNVLFVGVSGSQVREDPEAGRFEVVYNSVDVESIPYSEKAETPPYVLFLGRLTRNKGVHLAIEAARRASMKLVIGGIVPSEEGSAEYFEREVKPCLGPDCVWIGAYDNETRFKLVTGATALLFPIQWNEPFSVALVESLAGGLPVVALRRASTPEAIIDGKTGFLCDTVEDMVEGIRRAHGISRRACRESARERFSEETFIKQVERLVSRAVGATP
jgi:glycosyltransferase involved in cell wall biosynthesis